MERSWRPPWAHMAPGSAPEGSRPSFSTLRGLPGEHFSLISMLFSTWFSSCFTEPFGLLVRLRARLRALFFANFKWKKIKVESPGSLNPWVAAGGREAIRISWKFINKNRN